MYKLLDPPFDMMVLVRKALPITREELMFLKNLCYSNNIYDLRKERKISQNKMAEETGISRRALSMIENGEQNVSLDYAYRISTYFNLLVHEVFPLMVKEQSNNSEE